MDQEQIDAYNQEQALNKEKAGADALAIALSRSVSKSVSESSSEIQQAIVGSLKVLLKVIKENEPSVTVKNQSTFPSSISTPDVAKVVTAVSELKKAVSQKETDFTAVIKSLDALSKSVASLPKPVDTVTVKNQPDYKSEFETLNKTIQTIDVKPVVNLPQPKVTVTSDFKEITKQLTDVIKAVNSIKFPEIPKNDFSEVTKAVKGVKDSINGLRFPVPNFILPFKDINGKSVQVQLDASGNLKTVSSGGAEIYKKLIDGTTTTSVTYIGEAALGTALSASSWRIKKINESASPIVITWGGTGIFDQIWDNRVIISYS